MPVSIRCFGAPCVDLGDASAAAMLPFERRSQLLLCLALRGGWVARTELAALLWPEQAERQAHANLRKTVFRLAQVPWGRLVEAREAALRVSAPTDVQAFERALAEGDVEAALGCVGGPLLQGCDDDANEAWTGWLRFERGRLHAAWRAAALGWLALPASSTEAAVQLSARLLEDDPLDEPALRAHVQALAAGGQLARARERWQRYVDRLHDELGMAPSAELRALRDTLVEAGPPVEPRAVPAGPASGSALSAPPPTGHGFVGRTVELRQIADRLAGRDLRMLTLIGPGGIGKTTLARRAAPDAPFVSLDETPGAEALLLAIARATGAPLRGNAAVADALHAALGSRSLRLVLDNAESLFEGDAPGTLAALTRLLEACPGVQLLVTSRRRLGIPHEHLLVLEGLPCPEADDLDRIEAFDAVRLFVSAARRVEPAFAPHGDAAAIVEICRRVDGLPLAIELAAAWTRMLSCETIAAELRQGTGLLHGPDGSAASRHAGIDVVFERSWQQLAPGERVVLARLAVFQGSFGVDAARSVSRAPWPVLGALADKSLLRREGDRLSLHPLLQQLALARLEPAAVTDVRDAHADHYRKLLTQLGPALANGERSALRRVDDELGNCIAAWDWCIERGDVEAVRACVRPLHNHHDHRGLNVEGLALIERAVATRSLHQDRLLHALLLCCQAQHAYRLDRYDDAIALATRVLDSGRPRDPDLLLRAHNILGTCALRRGLYERARRHFRHGLRLARAREDEERIAAMLDHAALTEKHLGRLDAALDLSLESLARHRRIDDRPSVALCLANLASLYHVRGDLDAAQGPLLEALGICERDGLGHIHTHVVAGLAELALLRGELDEGEARTATALTMAVEAGNRATAAWARVLQARLDARRGRHPAARAALAEALREILALGLRYQQFGAVIALAEVLCSEGDPLAADRLLAVVATHPGLPRSLDTDIVLSRRSLGLPREASAGPPDGLAFDELLQRIVSEAGDAHRSLRRWLRADPAAA